MIDSDTPSEASTPTAHTPSAIFTDRYPQTTINEAIETNKRVSKRRRDQGTESQFETISNDILDNSTEVQPYNTRTKVRVVAPSYVDCSQVQVLTEENTRLKQELLKVQIKQSKESNGLHRDDEHSLTGDEETFYDAKMDSSSEDLQHQLEILEEAKQHLLQDRQSAADALQAIQIAHEKELAQMKFEILGLTERNRELERAVQDTEKMGSKNVMTLNDDLETEMYVQGAGCLGDSKKPSDVRVLERELEEKSAQVNSTEDELKRLRSQVDEMEKANMLLEEKQRNIDIMEAKLAELESNLHEPAKITKINEGLQKQETIISMLEAELMELRSHVDDLTNMNEILQDEKIADVKKMETELTNVKSQVEGLKEENISLQLANERILAQQVSYDDKLHLILDSHNDEVNTLAENHRQVVSGFDTERIQLQRELDLAKESLKSLQLEGKRMADIDDLGSMRASYESRIEDLQTQLRMEQNRNTELAQKVDDHTSSLEQSELRLLAIISGKEEEISRAKGLYDEEKNVRQMELATYRTKIENLEALLAQKDDDIVSAQTTYEQETQRLSFEYREKMVNLESDCNKLTEDLQVTQHRHQQDMVKQQQRFDAERSVFTKSNETVRELKGKLEGKNRILQSRIRELEEEHRTLKRAHEQERLKSLEEYANQINSQIHQREQEVSKYQDDIRTMTTDLENLRETVLERDESITSLNRTKAALESQLADQSAQIASLASKVQIVDATELATLREECDRLLKVVAEKDCDIEREETMVMALKVEMERMKSEADLAANKTSQTVMADANTGQPDTARGKQKQISPSALSSAFPLTAARKSNYRAGSSDYRAGSSSRNVRFGSPGGMVDPISQYASTSRGGGHATESRDSVSTRSNYMTPSSSSRSAMIDTSHIGRDRTPPIPPPRIYGKARRASSSQVIQGTVPGNNSTTATPPWSPPNNVDENYSDEDPRPEVSPAEPSLKGLPSSSSDPALAEALIAVAAKIGEMSDNLTALPGLLSTPQRRHSTPRRSPFRSATTTPRPREANRSDFVYKVRRSMNKLLGDIKTDSDITTAFANGHYITEDENNAFECGMMESDVSIAFLKPYWDKLGCEYNIRLSHLFTQSFIQEYPEFRDNSEDVEDYFHQRLKTLRTRLTQVIPRSNESEQQRQKRVQSKTLEDARINRRNSRRTYGFKRRLNDATERAEIDPSYIPIRDTIAILGPRGYSSDETDPENQRSYIIRRKLWRNKKLIKTMKLADDLHRTTNINGNNLPGAPVGTRHRDPCGPISDAPPPANLPENFYEARWTTDLSTTNHILLGPKSPEPFFGEDSDD